MFIEHFIAVISKRSKP